MSILALEGVVEHGQIRLKTSIHLPEGTKVYVIAPEALADRTVRIFSPRLADPEQVVDFEMEISEASLDAGLQH